MREPTASLRAWPARFAPDLAESAPGSMLTLFGVARKP